jgi:hypothetical protein
MFQIAEGWITPKGISNSYKAQNRLQVSARGDTVKWLSLCDTANINYEINSISEVLERYEVDGIHLDYIRYQSDDYDYNTKCRAPFEEYLGFAVDSWPEDVISGAHKARYAKFKINQITNVVRAARRVIDSIQPEAELSAAVYADYTTAISWVSQDWPTWMADSLLDFLAPMNYTNSASTFEANLNTELSLANNIPVYSGIGSFAGMPLSTLTEQINITRQKKTGGFILFAQDAELYNYTIPFLEASMLKGSATEVDLENKNEDTMWNIEPIEITPIGFQNTLMNQPKFQDKIFFHNQEGQAIELRVLNSMGQVIVQENVAYGEGLTLNTLAKGFYLVRVLDQSFQFRIK